MIPQYALRIAAFAALIAATTIGCSSGGETPGGPGPGRIRVNTATTGAELDPDGYNVVLNNVVGIAVADNGSATVPNVVPGTVIVGLINVAPNCSIIPPLLRTLTVVADQTIATDYSVTCLATGTLNLKVDMTGGGYDRDTTVAYQVDLLAAAFAYSGFDSSFTLPVGQHSIAVTQMASHCSEPNGLVRPFTITPGDTTVVEYDIVCTAITGLISATMLTTGATPDPDGYFVALDGVPKGHIGVPNSGVTFLLLTPGPHSVTISDIAANCTLAGLATRQYTVIAGVTVSDTFNIACP